MNSTLAWPRPRSTRLVVRALRALWTLPTNVCGHAVGMLVSGTRGRRIATAGAVGRVYAIRPGPLSAIGAVTIGHAILCTPEIITGLRGRLILAHELAHTRQHDVLGPFYLPLHVLAQVVSALAFFARPIAGKDPVHAKNPLEQRWLCLGYDAALEIARGERLSDTDRERFLAVWGV